MRKGNVSGVPRHLAELALTLAVPKLRSFKRTKCWLKDNYVLFKRLQLGQRRGKCQFSWVHRYPANVTFSHY